MKKINDCYYLTFKELISALSNCLRTVEPWKVESTYSSTVISMNVINGLIVDLKSGKNKKHTHTQIKTNDNNVENISSFLFSFTSFFAIFLHIY